MRCRLVSVYFVVLPLDVDLPYLGVAVQIRSLRYTDDNVLLGFRAYRAFLACYSDGHEDGGGDRWGADSGDVEAALRPLHYLGFLLR